MVTIIPMILLKNLGPNNTIIISADIENQINQFEKEEKKLYEYD